jgi:hypothetical protein
MLSFSILYTRFERVIIVLVQVGAVQKICVAAMQALGKKETEDEAQFTTQICGKTSLAPSYFLLENFHSQLRV